MDMLFIIITKPTAIFADAKSASLIIALMLSAALMILRREKHTREAEAAGYRFLLPAGNINDSLILYVTLRDIVSKEEDSAMLGDARSLIISDII